jgi:N-acetylglucosamine-6-phosphate deacetylase
MIAIDAGCVLTPLRSISPAVVLVDGAKIAAVGSPGEVSIPADAQIMDATDRIVVPGFVDTHTHGRDGSYFGEEAETTAALCQAIARTGVTALLPTLACLLPVQYTLDMILDRIRVVRQVMASYTAGSEILGIHMEGPYLSGDDAARGSQLAINVRKPSTSELHRMVEASEGTIRKMSIAPELDGALDVIREMVRLGVVACAAHSMATYQQAMRAVDVGLRCATHVFNGMIPLHHRRPGLLGAVLTCDQINAELIADGQHVSPAAMEILLRCKGVERVHIVTDNTTWAGMPDGEYEDGSRTIVKERERAYVVGGTLIGSVAPMNLCVRNLVRAVGCSLAKAVRMAALGPAMVIGVGDRKGSLEPGKDADLVVIDQEVEVYTTMVRGQVVYRAD